MERRCHPDHQYDETLQVGDLVRTYHAGIWRITEIVPQFVDERWLPYCKGAKLGDPRPPMVQYEKVLNDNLSPAKKTKQTCSICWCHRVTEESLKAELKEINDRFYAALNCLFGPG